MDLDALLRRQHGVLTHAQAVRAGLTEDAIRWRVTKGHWTRIARGIYHAYPGQLDWFGRAHALTLRLGPHAALTLETAAHLHGVETRQPPIITAAVNGRQVERLDRRVERPLDRGGALRGVVTGGGWGVHVVGSVPLLARSGPPQAGPPDARPQVASGYPSKR